MSLEPYVVLLFLLVPLVEWVVRRVREASARPPTAPQRQPAPGQPAPVRAAPTAQLLLWRRQRPDLHATEFDRCPLRLYRDATAI